MSNEKNITLIFLFRNDSNVLERQELMRPSTSKVSANKTEVSTTGWLDSDDENDDEDRQPLLNQNVLKQQQQYLLKGEDNKYLRLY